MTGPEVGDHLARLADLHEQLASTLRDLAESSRIRLPLLETLPQRALVENQSGTVPVPAAEAGELLTQAEMCSLLQVNERTLRRMRQQGAVPKPLQINGLVRWRRASVERWLKDGAKPCR